LECQHYESAIVDKLVDQDMIQKAALYASNETMRCTAVRKVTDQALLIKLATEENNIAVRCAAVKKIDDKDVVEQIAKNDSSELVRRIAVYELTNQSVLAEIALNDIDADVRYAAVRGLEDQYTLNKVAQTDKASFVRREVLNKINVQSIIAWVAENEENENIRKEAFGKIFDKTLIEEIKQRKNNSIHEIKNITDQTKLRDIAQSSGDSDIRFAALQGITDAKILTELVMHGKHNDVRMQSIKMLPHKGMHILPEIAKCDRDGHIRDAANSTRSDKLHKWVAMPGCRKKCSICGLIAYDHNWVCTFSPKDADRADASYYKCSKCGMECSEGGNSIGECEWGYIYP